MSLWQSIKMSIVKRLGRGRAEEADPLKELGITVWRGNWLAERVDLALRTLHAVVSSDRPNYFQACRLLKVILVAAAMPWLRGDREFRRELNAWLELYKSLENTYRNLHEAGRVWEECGEPQDGDEIVVCELRGESAEDLNNHALDVYTSGLHLIYDSWRREDVDVNKIFLIQHLAPPPQPYQPVVPGAAMPPAAPPPDRGSVEAPAREHGGG